MKNTSKSLSCLIMAIVLMLSVTMLAVPAMAVAQLDTAQGDVNDDGYVTEEDLTLLDNILQGLAPFTDYADVDGNNIVDQLDKTVLQNLLGAEAPITDPNDLLDNVSQVALEGNSGPATALMQATVTKGDSTVALKFWSQAANGNPVAKLSFEKPLDLSQTDAIGMDLLFVNSNDKQIQVSLLTGAALTQSDTATVLMTSDKAGWTEGVVLLSQFAAADLTDIRAIQFHYNSVAQTQTHMVYVDNLRTATFTLGGIGDQLESGFYLFMAATGQQGIISADQNWPYLTGTFSDNLKVNGQSIGLPIQYTGIGNRLFISYNDEMKTILEAAKELKAPLYLEISAGSTFVLGGQSWVVTEDLIICNSFDESGAMSWKACDHEEHTESVPQLQGIKLSYIHEQNSVGMKLHLATINEIPVSGTTTGWPTLGGNWASRITLNGQPTSLWLKWTDAENYIYIDILDGGIVENAIANKSLLVLTIPKGTTLELDGYTWIFCKDQRICNVFADDGTMGWMICDHQEHAEQFPVVTGVEFANISGGSDTALKLALNPKNVNDVSGSTMNWPVMGGNYDATVTLNGQDVAVTIKWPDHTNNIWIDFGSDMQYIIADAKELKAPLYLTFPKDTTLELDGCTWTFYKDQTVCNYFNEDGTMGWQICSHSHTEAVPVRKGMDVASIGDVLDVGFYIVMAPRGQSNITGAEWAHMEGTFKNKITLNGVTMEMGVQYAGPANRLFLSYSDAMKEAIALAKASKATLYITLPANSGIGFDGITDTWMFDKEIVFCNTFDDAGNMGWKICDHAVHTEELPGEKGINVANISGGSDTALKLALTPENVNEIAGSTGGWPVMGGNYDATITLNGQDVGITIKWPDHTNHIWIDFGGDMLNIMEIAKALQAPLYLTIPEGTTLELDGYTWTFLNDQIICNYFNEDGTMGWKICDHTNHTEPVPVQSGVDLRLVDNCTDTYFRLFLNPVNVDSLKSATPGWFEMGGNYRTNVTLNGRNVSVTLKYPDVENAVWVDFGADMQAIIADAKEMQAPLYLTFPKATTLELDGKTWSFYKDQTVCNFFNEDGTMGWKICDHASHAEPVPVKSGVDLRLVDNCTDTYFRLFLNAVNVDSLKSATPGWFEMGGSYRTNVTLNGRNVSVTIKYPDVENAVWVDFGADMQAIIADAKEMQAPLYLTFPKATTLELDGKTWTFYKNQTVCNFFNEDGTMGWKICDHASHAEPVPVVQGIRLNYIHEQNPVGMKLHLIAVNEAAVSGTTTGWPTLGGNWSTNITLNGQPVSLWLKWTDAENFIYIDILDGGIVDAAIANKTSLVLNIPKGTTLELDGYTWTFYKDQTICNVFDDAGNMSWVVGN